MCILIYYSVLNTYKIHLQKDDYTVFFVCCLRCLTVLRIFAMFCDICDHPVEHRGPCHAYKNTAIYRRLPWKTSITNNTPELNPLNPELNPICCLLALLGAHHFLHVSRIRVKSVTFRLLMSYIYIYIYIYGAPILDVSRSHTTTQHSR